MYQIMVTILCRLCPPYPKGNWPFSSTGKPPLSVGNPTILVAQCSATPATVPAKPPCSATPFQTQISVRHLPGMGGGKVRHQNF